MISYDFTDSVNGADQTRSGCDDNVPPQK